MISYQTLDQEYKKTQQVLIQNENIENPLQKLNLLSDNMFDYIVRLLVWAVEGGAKVSLHPVYAIHCNPLNIQFRKNTLNLYITALIPISK